MTLRSLVNPIVSFFTGDILEWIKIALIMGVVTFVGFLWFDRSSLQNQLIKSKADNFVIKGQLSQMTSDIEDVRIKQELAIQERDSIKIQTAELMEAMKKQKLPTDCKELVKWAAKNKNDTKW
jgi:hypothetical protein